MAVIPCGLYFHGEIKMHGMLMAEHMVEPESIRMFCRIRDFLPTEIDNMLFCCMPTEVPLDILFYFSIKSSIRMLVEYYFSVKMACTKHSTLLWDLMTKS